MMKNPRVLLYGTLFIFLGLAGAGVYQRTAGKLSAGRGLTKAKLARALDFSEPFYKYPTEIDLAVDEGDQKIRAVFEYGFDAKLQESMEGLFRTYSPDFGAFVALDAQTGQVLSMVSYSSHSGQALGNLALRSSFPSASVFKMVTAAAAIENRKLSPDTLIQFNGGYHTLYKGNVLNNRINRWTRQITLKQAFARSVNTVFGRIGAYNVGAVELKDTASRFGFNRQIAADVPIQQGVAFFPSDAFGLAESASGYTRDNRMSPLQGALMAAAIANDGLMMEPYVVRTVYTPDGKRIYQAEPTMANQTVDARTAEEVRELMRETVTRGTSRHAFRGFFRGEFAGLEVGGKTGSLTGEDPPGKYDWFVGYAKSGQRRIAVAALTINEKNWKVKSAYLARRAIETMFRGWSSASVAMIRDPR